MTDSNKEGQTIDWKELLEQPADTVFVPVGVNEGSILVKQETVGESAEELDTYFVELFEGAGSENLPEPKLFGFPLMLDQERDQLKFRVVDHHELMVMVQRLLEVTPAPDDTGTILIHGPVQIGKTLVQDRIRDLLTNLIGARCVKMDEPTHPLDKFDINHADWELGIVRRTSWRVGEYCCGVAVENTDKLREGGGDDDSG